MKVGVVILNYNTPELTIQCVKEFLQQETYPYYEIVVVDNASPGSHNIVFFKNHLPPLVTLLESKENGGYSAGNNLGARFLIEQRNCDAILILNSDAFLIMPILEQLVLAISEPTIMAISPLVLDESQLFDWKKTNQVRRVYPALKTMVVNSALLGSLPFLRKYKDHYIYQDCWPWKDNFVYKTDSINGAAFLIKSDFLKNEGYMDEKVFLYHEELILGIQIKNKGFYCALHTGVRVLHKQGMSTGATKKSISRSMYEHQLESYEHIFSEYYKVSFFLRKSFRVLKIFEYNLKRAFEWI